MMNAVKEEGLFKLFSAVWSTLCFSTARPRHPNTKNRPNLLLSENMALNSKLTFVYQDYICIYSGHSQVSPIVIMVGGSTLTLY